MSYNIDKWTTKKLNNLIIPLSAFFKHKRSDWHPKVVSSGNDEIILECGCEQTIKGELVDGNIHVSKFEFTGEGSGTFYNWILEPALKESTGELEAVLIWEGGDSISRLVVNDGNVISEDIDL